MSACGKFLGATALSLVFTVPANAQAPQTEKNVSMKMALMIMDGALEQCSKDGYKVSVVLVDKGGNVAASVRGDSTNPHSMEFAPSRPSMLIRVAVRSAISFSLPSATATTSV